MKNGCTWRFPALRIPKAASVVRCRRQCPWKRSLAPQLAVGLSTTRATKTQLLRGWLSVWAGRRKGRPTDDPWYCWEPVCSELACADLKISWKCWNFKGFDGFAVAEKLFTEKYWNHQTWFRAMAITNANNPWWDFGVQWISCRFPHFPMDTEIFKGEVMVNGVSLLLCPRCLRCHQPIRIDEWINSK